MTPQQSEELKHINEILDEIIERQLELRKKFIFWLNLQEGYLAAREIPEAHEKEQTPSRRT